MKESPAEPNPLMGGGSQELFPQACTIVIFGATGNDVGFQRFTAEYDLTDSVELTVGVVIYQSGDLRRTQGIGDNDRVFCEVQYNF